MTDWKIDQCIKGWRPLVVLPDWLIFYKKGCIYKVRHDLKRPILLCVIQNRGLLGRLFKNSRIVDRVLRLSPSHAIIFDNALFIAQRSNIWRYDFNEGNLNLDFEIPNDGFSLSFSIVLNKQGLEELVFGEYFENLAMDPIRIWGRKSGSNKWLIRAKFAIGEINHIHSIFCANTRVYILTGDFDQAAGIWVSDPEFSTLKPLLRGKQSNRAAWMKKIDNHIFFANDTPLEQNRLFKFEITNENNIRPIPLADLNGSSIYASGGIEEIFFSTTVEPGLPTGNFISDMLDSRLGPGVLSSKASLMSIDRQGVVSELYSAEKDNLPFRLMQFGTFIFPSGTMLPNTLYCYGVALKNIDNSCLVFRRQKC
jgi:hypothetical protein